MEKTNRRGRPTLDADGNPSQQVTVRLPPKEFDTLYKRATQHGMSVAEAIRRDIRRGGHRDPQD
jgi:hypothetical protein